MNKKTRTLLKENNQFEKNLNEKNIKVITDIVVYLRGCDISEYHQEEVRRDIMQMIADGEKRNEDINSVIGEDYKTFCDEIVSAFPARSKKEKFLNWSSQILYLFSIMSLIWFFSSIISAFSGKTPITSLPITLGFVINSILITLISSIFVSFICKTSFNENVKLGKFKTFLISWIVLFIIFGIFIFIGYFLRTELLRIPFYVGLLLIIIPFILSKILDELQ
jgi:DNA-binding ferritin-like protein (Dps family)